MIWADSINRHYTDEATGDRYAVVDLFADTAESPTTMANVSRLPDKEPYDTTTKIGVGSTLYVVDSAELYIMNSSLNWVIQ